MLGFAKQGDLAFQTYVRNLDYNVGFLLEKGHDLNDLVAILVRSIPPQALEKNFRMQKALQSAGCKNVLRVFEAASAFSQGLDPEHPYDAHSAITIAMDRRDKQSVEMGRQILRTILENRGCEHTVV